MADSPAGVDHLCPVPSYGGGPTGRAIEVTDPERIAAMLTGRGLAPGSFSDSPFFAADIAEVVLTRLEGPAVVIDLWRPGQGLRTLRRV